MLEESPPSLVPCEKGYDTGATPGLSWGCADAHPAASIAGEGTRQRSIRTKEARRKGVCPAKRESHGGLIEGVKRCLAQRWRFTSCRE